VIYEAQKADDWTSSEVWKKANPNLGVSVSEEYLRRECQRAREIPSYENTFKRLFLNVRTEQATRWISMDRWDGCALTMDWGQLAGRECYGGLDISSVNDITSFVLVFPEGDEERKYLVLPYFWVPEVNAQQRERADRVPYLTWMKRGLIESGGAECIDQAVILKKILELSQRFSIRKIAYDPWNAEALAMAIGSAGIECEKWLQGYATMNGPSKEFERAVIGNRLRHDGNPVLRWMASNVCVVERDGDIRPSKKRSFEKIDGIVASIMAIGCCQKTADKESVYKERGLLFL
jgi:phage terminase large subunit-like protein